MNLKANPNHQQYLQALARMMPAERLRRTFELSEFTRALFKQGLQRRFSDLSPTQLHQLYLERLELCHNRNY